MNNHAIQAQHWLTHSYVVHDAQAVECALDKLAKDIQQHISAPIVLMCVMRGGMYLAGQLMAKINLPMQIDYLQVNRYQGTQGDEIVWKQLPSLDLTTQTVLIVDDILDAGITMVEVMKRCQQAGAERVLNVVLAEKLNAVKKPIQADFVGLTVPDAYVFGCGMDVHGWWRNLPEIRALNATAQV